MSKEQQSADEHRRAQKESQDFADQARERVTEIQERQNHRYNSFVQAALGFLNVEADTGLTLARLAADAKDAEQMTQQTRQARKAYDTVVKYLGKAHVSREDLNGLEQKLARLRDLLKSLGEKF